jgi:hypothetical protein
MCVVKIPTCPPGYTWLYQLGQACFKVVGPVNQTVGATYNSAEHPIANTMCSLDRTRLAVAETTSESTALSGWLKTTTNNVKKPL